jgi:hypothetical protein
VSPIGSHAVTKALCGTAGCPYIYSYISKIK